MIHQGDCLDVFGAEPDESFDAFVSDPPAGVAFMSRAWDKDHGGRDKWVSFWAARFAMARRKAKPGAYSLTWALPRTSHWTATALDDAGWVIQDVLTHVFGQGWPKGRSALKPASEHWILARNGSGGTLQIDAARVARGERPKIVATRQGTGTVFGSGANGSYNDGTTELGSWPPNFMLSHCPDCEERGTRTVKSGARPNCDGRVYGHGTPIYGDMGGAKYKALPVDANGLETVPAFDCLAACDCGLSRLAPSGGAAPRCACGAAMWWACPVAEMDAQSGELAPPGNVNTRTRGLGYGGGDGSVAMPPVKDHGGASRFFPCFGYHAKASGGERDAGCDELYWRANKRNPFGFDRVTRAEWEAIGGDPEHERIRVNRRDDQQPDRARGNVHPTIKGIALMERLVALVTQPGGRIGDLCAGSGGTRIAVHRLNEARGLGASFLGAELCPEAIEIADARLAWWRSVRRDTKPVKRADDAATVAQGRLF